MRSLMTREEIELMDPNQQAVGRRERPSRIMTRIARVPLIAALACSSARELLSRPRPSSRIQAGQGGHRLRTAVAEN